MFTVSSHHWNFWCKTPAATRHTLLATPVASIQTQRRVWFDSRQNQQQQLYFESHCYCLTGDANVLVMKSLTLIQQKKKQKKKLKIKKLNFQRIQQPFTMLRFFIKRGALKDD